MPRLLMDTDSLRETLANLHSLREQMNEQMCGLSQQIDYMVTVSWLSLSAVDFGNDFSYCEQTITYLLAELDELMIDLEREISEWEEAGNTFARFDQGPPAPVRTPRYYNPFG